MVPSLTYAVVLVFMIIGLAVPVMLYGIGLAKDGWTWEHCALFVSIIASTDAVAGRAGLYTSSAYMSAHTLPRGVLFRRGFLKDFPAKAHRAIEHTFLFSSLYLPALV